MEKRYSTMQDQKSGSGLARYQDFTTGGGLEPKVKNAFQKC